MSAIEKISGVCGGRACVAGTRVPVWVLIECHEHGLTDAEILENYPTVGEPGLRAAYRYREENEREIFEEIEYGQAR